jgi:hypothetical protein
MVEAPVAGPNTKRAGAWAVKSGPAGNNVDGCTRPSSSDLRTHSTCVRGHPPSSPKPKSAGGPGSGICDRTCTLTPDGTVPSGQRPVLETARLGDGDEGNSRAGETYAKSSDLHPTRKQEGFGPKVEKTMSLMN